MCVCVYICAYIYTHTYECLWVYSPEYRFPQRPRMASDPLEWNTWAVVSCIIWELGTELSSSARTACTLNRQSTSPFL